MWIMLNSSSSLAKVVHCISCPEASSIIMLQAFLCGLFGALASVCGKLSLSSNYVTAYLESSCLQNSTVSHVCNEINLVYRGIMFAGMIIFNGLMLGYFMKALEKSSSIVVTTLSSSISFLLTGVLGYLILSEKVGLRWILGAVLITGGIGLIVMSQMDFSKK